ncbi:hypothetical protein B0H19DRAFT_1055801 [Mycena capillaripes]|nr:hypothetical protein B0H19DRAFT_1055801 [Mycena capillaripes]
MPAPFFLKLTSCQPVFLMMPFTLWTDFSVFYPRSILRFKPLLMTSVKPFSFVTDLMKKWFGKYLKDTILLKRLERLFKSYENIQCSNKKSRGSFFSDVAKEMALHLLCTMRDGYLSDLSGISLYYLMGKDRDGLNLYRTIHRHNTSVGFHNRTGQKFRGHYDHWVRDEIVELTIAVASKPSFPLPRVLSTRITTSETIGILPIFTSLAESVGITTLPRRRVVGVPHHRDTPVHTLTRLSTKPTNQYCYLQLRQLTLYAVLPVHTFKEYTTFKANINQSKYRKGGKEHPPHEHWKNIDFENFTCAWNALIDAQPPHITDLNQQLYYKIPQQLEAHHKKTLLWNSECSTLAYGSNFAARQPFLDLLATDGNHVDVLPATPLPDAPPDGKLDLSVNGITLIFCPQMIPTHSIEWL